MSPWQIVFSLLAGVFGLFVIYVILQQRRWIKQTDKLTPVSWSVGGKLIRMNFENAIQFIRSIAHLFPMRAWFSPLQLVVVLKDPDDVQIILNDPKVAEKAYFYKFFNSDHGLLASQHHIWKVHRKIMNPAFAISNIRANMIPVFDEKTDFMLKQLRLIGEGVDCELVDLIKFSLVETSLATFADEECGKDEIEEYSRCMSIRIESVARRFLNLFLHWNTLYRLTNYYRLEQKCVKSMEKFVGKIISNHRRKWPEGQSERKLIVDLLMSRLKDNQITEREVIEELDTLLFTSVDTSTHLIIFTLLVIAMRPRLQEDLITELQSVFYSPEVPFDYDQLKKLELMERVIKETMRIYPIVPFAIKEAKAPIQLSNCTVPKGALTLISMMSIHEDTKYWGPNATDFNPDNFLPKNVKNRHPHAFIPFALGRNCIGMVYAKFSILSMISKILMNYRLESSVEREEDIQTEYKITVNLKNKNPFRLFQRTDFYNNNEGTK